MNFKISIDNGTDWPTSEFRRLFLACAKHEGMAYDGTYTVELYYPRGGGGWGYYNRRHMKIALRNWVGFAEDRNRATTASAVNIATAIIHEMGHNRGLKHKDMNGRAEAAAAREVCEALGLTVLQRVTAANRAKVAPTREEKARAELERVEAKLVNIDIEHAFAVARWTKKRRKAKAAVRRYDRINARLANELLVNEDDRDRIAAEPTQQGEQER